MDEIMDKLPRIFLFVIIFAQHAMFNENREPPSIPLKKVYD